MRGSSDLGYKCQHNAVRWLYVVKLLVIFEQGHIVNSDNKEFGISNGICMHERPSKQQAVRNNNRGLKCKEDSWKMSSVYSFGQKEIGAKL